MTNTMRTLGMIVRAMWPDGDVPQNVWDIVTVRPATAVGLLGKMMVRLDDTRQAEIADLMQRLPADLTDPSGGVPTDDQGPFWIGYYHYSTALKRAQMLGPDALRKVGEALYGERWQTDIARDLGLSDARRVRQWLSNDRPIPAGVWADLNVLVNERRMLLDNLANPE